MNTAKQNGLVFIDGKMLLAALNMPHSISDALKLRERMMKLRLLQNLLQMPMQYRRMRQLKWMIAKNPK